MADDLPQSQPDAAPDQTLASLISDDDRNLRRLGYQPELRRRMSAFSNFAISLSLICILAGGITSFPFGFCGVGGAAIGLGWPLLCAFSLIVALSMAQIASAFPTAGGCYHWAAILGGRGWGWTTAWFNLIGLITVVAAVDAGAYPASERSTEGGRGLRQHPRARSAPRPPPEIPNLNEVASSSPGLRGTSHLG